MPPSKESFADITSSLNRALRDYKPPAGVHLVYNPLEYAEGAFLAYCRRFGMTGSGQRKRVARGRVLLLGMNPGPWGMAQTGIPFGAVSMVRDWLRIKAEVGRPAVEHPKRPVLGLACEREEVSGARLWGWARDRFGSPAAFFRHFFVYNYCPLMFMEESGRNVTPDKLPASFRDTLFSACDDALRALVHLIEPSMVVGVGTFAEKRAAACVDGHIPVARILHPSPASPLANRDWAGTVTRQLRAMPIAALAVA